MAKYQPPFEISASALQAVAEIFCRLRRTAKLATGKFTNFIEFMLDALHISMSEIVIEN